MINLKQTKGSLLKYVIKIIRANKTGVYDEILTEDEKRFVNQQVLDAVWYPYDFYKKLYNAIRKVEVVTRYERRRIPHSCVNSFRNYNFFRANQYVILCC